MKRIIVFILLLTIGYVTSANAQIRTVDKVIEIANHHFSTKTHARNSRALGVPLQTIPASAILKQTSKLSTKSSSAEAFYVVVGDSGFVIVSGEDRMLPILGYSEQSGFNINNIPTAMKWLLTGYATEFEGLQRTPIQTPDYLATSQSTLPESISSMLDSKGIAWDQRSPYNDQCPVIDGQRALTGCVATGMAMIMMYHQYPSQGKGSLDGFDFSLHALDWESMKNLSTPAGRQAVSWLMLSCGKAVESNYGLAETSAGGPSILSALTNYYEYDKNMQYIEREAFLSDAWNNTLKKEIAEGRPVPYFGHTSNAFGHCFVLDGYDQQDLFHINWGWSGSMNGNYTLTSLHPGFSGPGSSIGGFNVGQGAVIGIQKPTGDGKYKSNFSGLGVGIALSKESMLRNSNFDIARIPCVNYSNTFTGDIQPVLFQNNVFVSVLGTPIRINDIGYKKAPATDIAFNNVTIPAELPDGEYQLYVATKDTRESEWQPIKLSQNMQLIAPYYKVAIGASGVQFINPVDMGGLSLTAFKTKNSLYERSSAKFTISVFNAGSEWLGRIGVQLQLADKSKSPVVIAQDRQVFMPGENSFEMLEESLELTKGNYLMQPVYSMNGVNFFPLAGSSEQPVTVAEIDYNAFSLSLTSYRPLRPTITEKDHLQFELNIKNSGAGPFDDKIRVLISNKSGSGTYQLPDYKVFIDKDEEKTIMMDSSERLPDGEYNVEISYVHFQQGKKVLISDVCDFSVRSLTGSK